MSNQPIPLSLITGFLGSGKTTLLNGLLANTAMKNTAIIINEFGDVGIDHLLVESSNEDILELNDGCLCCTVRGDLVDTLTRLLARQDRNPIERIIIETTGLADPAPILHAIMTHPMLVDQIRLDGVITLVETVRARLIITGKRSSRLQWPTVLCSANRKCKTTRKCWTICVCHDLTRRHRRFAATMAHSHPPGFLIAGSTILKPNQPMLLAGLGKKQWQRQITPTITTTTMSIAMTHQFAPSP